MANGRLISKFVVLVSFTKLADAETVRKSMFNTTSTINDQHVCVITLLAKQHAESEGFGVSLYATFHSQSETSNDSNLALQ